MLKHLERSVACSTLFSSAVSENNSLRIDFEGTSLVRRIEGLASAARDNNRHCEPEAWQSSIPDGGQSACSTLFSSAVSENNSLRIGLEGTSLVRRIEGLASAVRDANRHCEPKAWQSRKGKWNALLWNSNLVVCEMFHCGN